MGIIEGIQSAIDNIIGAINSAITQDNYLFALGIILVVLFILYVIYKILAWPFTKKAPSKPTEAPIITEAPTKPTIPPKPTGIPTKPTTTEAPEDNKDEEEQPIEIPEIKLDANTIILMFTIVVLAIVAIVFFMTRKQQPKRRAPVKHH